MKREKIYLLIIGVLLAVIIAQWSAMRKKEVIKVRLIREKAAPVAAVAPPAAAVPAKAAPKGKIAIVLDDWGYNTNNLDIAASINAPLTAAILPNLKYSAELSRRLHDMGFEVILHLPMEPREKYKLEKDTITVNMSASKIKSIIDKDLSMLENVKGVSNHMGSKATADARVMRIVLGELKKRGLYFLDSYTGKTVVAKIARQIGIPFAGREVFLDNSNDEKYIKAQLDELKEKAGSRGYAIGIGHDRKKTLQVLAEMVPELKRQGYKFVYVSQLVD